VTADLEAGQPERQTGGEQDAVVVHQAVVPPAAVGSDDHPVGRGEHRLAEGREVLRRLEPRAVAERRPGPVRGLVDRSVA
jgi:hypothetical protein